MASTEIANIVVPAIFNPYVQKLTEEKTKFIQSGIVQNSPQLNRWLAGGGMTLTTPTWKDLDNDAENVAGETLSQIHNGGTATVTPSELTTYTEVAIRLTRTKQWAAEKLQDYLSGSNAMTAIGGRVAKYEALRLQACALAILAGVFADNVANDSGDMVFDASVPAYTPGVTDFSADNLFNAQQTAGDSQELFKKLAVHSAVYTRMKKNNLIDFKQDSVTGASLATFQDLDVVFDDGMPKSGNVYTSYLFEPGALQIGFGAVAKPTEVHWTPESGNGIGGEILFRRWMYSIHPMGFAYTGATTASGGPDNDTLDNAASWNRTCPQRKQVGLAALITKEA